MKKDFSAHFFGAQAAWNSLGSETKQAYTSSLLTEFCLISPEAKKLFEENGTDMTAHAKKLADTLDFAFNPATQTPALVTTLKGLGRIPKHAGIAKIQYHFVITAAIIALRKLLNEEETSELQDDFFHVLVFVCDTMQEGAVEATA